MPDELCLLSARVSRLRVSAPTQALLLSPARWLPQQTQVRCATLQAAVSYTMRLTATPLVGPRGLASVVRSDTSEHAAFSAFFLKFGTQDPDSAFPGAVRVERCSDVTTGERNDIAEEGKQAVDL